MIEQADIQGIYKMLGRLEAKVDALSGIDSRLREVETTLERVQVEVSQIKTRTRPVPWHVWAGALSAIVSVVISVVVVVMNRGG